MAIEPDNLLWKRERPIIHGGALRNYMRGPEDESFPRGPNASPRLCADCDASDSQYESHSPSPASTYWYISSRDSSPNDRSSQSSIAESRTSLHVRGIEFAQLRNVMFCIITFISLVTSPFVSRLL